MFMSTFIKCERLSVFMYAGLFLCVPCLILHVYVRVCVPNACSTGSTPWLWLIASIETQQTSWIRVLREETILPPANPLIYLPLSSPPLPVCSLWRYYSGNIFSFETRQHFKCLPQWVLYLLLVPLALYTISDTLTLLSWACLFLLS